MKHIYRVPVDTKHFEDTIEKGKTYAELLPFLTEANKEHLLSMRTYDMNIRYWGSLPGTSNVKAFDTMQEGDEILFYRGGKYIASATIAYTTINPSMARYSWGELNGRTWELMYFLEDVKMMEVKAAVLNKAFGYKENGAVMGFNKVSDMAASIFIGLHGSVAEFVSHL